MPRRSRPAPVAPSDPAEVLRRARRDGATVSLDVELAGGETLSVSGVPRHVDGKAVELVTVAETVRRVLLGRVRSARVVPPRTAGKPTGAIADRWAEKW